MDSKGVLPNVHTYNSFIFGFCDSGKLGLAMELFEEMRMDGISPNFETFDTLIRGLCFGGRVADGLKVVSLMEEERGGYGDNISPYNSVLYGLYKEGSMEEAFEFLNRMASSFPRAVDRSLRILRFCQENKVGEAKMAQTGSGRARAGLGPGSGLVPVKLFGPRPGPKPGKKCRAGLG